MLVKVYLSANECKELETSKSYIKEILNELKQTFGEELTNELLYNKYFYFLSLDDEYIAIKEELLDSELSGYNELIVIKDVEGAEPISAAAVISAAASMASAVGASAAGITAVLSTTIVGSVTVAGVVATVANVAISMAISMGLNAIFAPDTSFKSDPSKSQGKQSKIFNNAPVVREQGGSVPVVYGNPYCGGVLISSSISSEDVKK